MSPMMFTDHMPYNYEKAFKVSGSVVLLGQDGEIPANVETVIQSIVMLCLRILLPKVYFCTFLWVSCAC